MLVFVSRTIEREESHLNELDSAIGDGDHGITMRTGFKEVSRQLENLREDTTITSILQTAGTAFMNSTGGAIGVILGKMLMAGGIAMRDHAVMGPAEFKTLLRSMESAVASTGKAKPGDKTILDPLHAAVEAVEAMPDSNSNLLDYFKEAARVADVAAQDTSRMICRIGRASRLGERSLGHPDPGAVSLSIILKSMAEWLARMEP
jgi:dihydroxyacetone kinase phosphoprotein-dependent L subunit